MRTSLSCWCAAVLLITASGAAAQAPAPLDLVRFYSFPGAFSGPASATSTGLGLSDRWLGDEPFDNPSAAPARGVMVAPEFQRVKRQDLLVDYANYQETQGNLDLAGGWLSLPVRGVGLTLYAFDPVLRSEDATFTTKPDDTGPPGTFAVTSSARELRAGLALSRAWRGARLGAAVEWTRREDSYDFRSVYQGRQDHVDFSGDGVGFQAGARVPVAAAVTLGAALRYVPSLDLRGTETRAAGELVQDVAAARAAGWEGGLSARWSVTEVLRVFASLGGRTAQAWDGFGATSGRAASWTGGFEYEEPGQPLTIRFGLGQEQQDGAPEPRAGAFALGAGWKSGTLRFDLGAMRRSFARPGRAASYDDRVVAGVTVGI